MLLSKSRFACRCYLPRLALNSDKCDWSKLCGGDWAELLVMRPLFADRCDWSKLDDEDWEHLRWHRSELADRRGK